MCEEGLHDPFQDQVECARFRAERDMLAQAMERVADDIEKTFLGFEGAEDAPAMRWAREFRAALGSLHAPVRDVTMGAYDLLPEAERDAITLVRDHGGLDAVKELLGWVVGHCSTKQQLDFDFWLSGRVMHELGFDEDMADREEVERRLLARLMPEGMEWLVEAWPRFEDDEPVRIGDEYECWCGGTHKANSVTLREGSSMINATNAHSFVVSDGPTTANGKRVKRPAPKALDADGVEIHKGDTVWTTRDLDKFTVTNPNNGQFLSVSCKDEGGDDYCCHPSDLTHRAPVPAADGKPLREGETVYDVYRGRAFTVHGIVRDGDGIGLAVLTDDRGMECEHFADNLTHERPEIDSWERLEDDAEKDPCDYFGFDEEETCGKCPASGKNCKQTMAHDLVRRAKALAEKEA